MLIQLSLGPCASGQTERRGVARETTTLVAGDVVAHPRGTISTCAIRETSPTLSMSCVLCGTLEPRNWRWRKTKALQSFSHLYCLEGPFVWRYLMNYHEPQCMCCVQCVFQMRKRSLPGKEIAKQMWPMDAYLLWLFRMYGKPDKRQSRRLSNALSSNMYLPMAGQPLHHVFDEASWLQYNIGTHFFRHAAAVAAFRRLDNI